METGLRELNVPGFIILKVRTEDTEQNRRVFDAFKQMARDECRNDYTITLRKLLEYYERDAKSEQMWYVIKMLEERIIALETAKKETTTKPEEGMF